MLKRIMSYVFLATFVCSCLSRTDITDSKARPVLKLKVAVVAGFHFQFSIIYILKRNTETWWTLN